MNSLSSTEKQLGKRSINRVRCWQLRWVPIWSTQGFPEVPIHGKGPGLLKIRYMLGRVIMAQSQTMGSFSLQTCFIKKEHSSFSKTRNMRGRAWGHDLGGLVPSDPETPTLPTGMWLSVLRLLCVLSVIFLRYYVFPLFNTVCLAPADFFPLYNSFCWLCPFIPLLSI